MEVIPQEKVEYSALSHLISSDTGSVQGFKEVFSDGLTGVLFLVNSGISMVKNSCVVVEGSSVGYGELADEIFD